ncbi:hypothetical protein [Nostoc sp.]|uniref:hypothetical protein n=1 Tax=Nostoc sp. TaxID=1180 RepID=UPI002FF87DCB
MSVSLKRKLRERREVERSRSAGYAYADGETAAQWFAFRQDYDLLILNWMLTE